MFPLDVSLRMMSFAHRASSSLEVSDVSAYVSDPVMYRFGLERPLPSGTPSVYWPRTDDPPTIVICPDAKTAPLGPMTPGACCPLGTPVYVASVAPPQLAMVPFVTLVVLAVRSMVTHSIVPPIVNLNTSVFAIASPVDWTVTLPTIYMPVVIGPLPPAVTLAPLMYSPAAPGNAGAGEGCGLPVKAAHCTA